MEEERKKFLKEYNSEISEERDREERDGGGMKEMKEGFERMTERTERVMEEVRREFKEQGRVMEEKMEEVRKEFREQQKE